MTEATDADSEFPRVDAECVLIDVETLLHAVKLAAVAARDADDLVEARRCAAAANSVIDACAVEMERLRKAIYAIPEVKD